MRKTITYCDLCEREIYHTNDTFRFKAKSPSFVTWSNGEIFNSDVRKFDICRDCLEEIGGKIRANKKRGNYSENH